MYLNLEVQELLYIMLHNIIKITHTRVYHLEHFIERDVVKVLRVISCEKQ
jgi:hypothetical protein